MRNLISCILLISLTATAHAGWLDSIFGGGDDESNSSATTTKSSTATTNTNTETGSAAAPITAAAKSVAPLIQGLSSELNIKPTQAEGGTGALLQMAKSALNSTDFAKLGAAIPNMDTLLAAAPAVTEMAKKSGGEGLLGDVMQKAGEYSETAKSINQLNAQFKSLGLDLSLIPTFITKIKAYLGDSGNQTAKDLFASAMSSFGL